MSVVARCTSEAARSSRIALVCVVRTFTESRACEGATGPQRLCEREISSERHRQFFFLHHVQNDSSDFRGAPDSHGRRLSSQDALRRMPRPRVFGVLLHEWQMIDIETETRERVCIELVLPCGVNFTVTTDLAYAPDEARGEIRELLHVLNDAAERWVQSKPKVEKPSKAIAQWRWWG